MRNLQKFIDEQNAWGSFFNTPAIQFPLSQVQVNDIANSLDCKLSPENLHCDGEISVAEANAKYNFYAKVYKELEDYCLKNWLDTPVVYEL
jgi:hypothetical protein